MRRGNVAPLAGAWIEIRLILVRDCPRCVAPLAGAWIEIDRAEAINKLMGRSLPSRERGLKYLYLSPTESKCKSLPSRERGLKYGKLFRIADKRSRSPRGSVD